MGHRSVLEAGEILFRQGELFSAIHLVVSGCLKLRETNAEGRERIVALRAAGEILGVEAWALGIHPHTAETITPVQLCQLQRPDAARVATRGAILEPLLRKTALQLDRSSDVWQCQPAVAKVARFLEQFNSRVGALPGRHLTRAEIGSLLGLAEETVVRAMTRLRDRGASSLR